MSDVNHVCPDCGTGVGKLHKNGCDVERCPDCGGQLFTCGCNNLKHKRIPWSGVWHGTKECIDFGWYSKRNPDGIGYIRCGKDDEGAGPDLNRFHEETIWDASKGTWVKKG
jgi:hypothetical protein